MLKPYPFNLSKHDSVGVALLVVGRKSNFYSYLLFATNFRGIDAKQENLYQFTFYLFNYLKVGVAKILKFRMRMKVRVCSFHLVPIL